MKKLLIIIVSFVYCAVLHAQRSYTLDFKLSDYKIEKKEGVVSIFSTKGAPCYLEDRNAPALPYFPYRILRPANTSTDDFSINYEKELICQDVDIEGNPAILPTDVNPAISINTFKATKSSESPVILGKDNAMYGYNYSYFKVSPFIYDYTTRNLYFVNRMTISLSIKNNNTKEMTAYNSDKAEEVKRWILNPEDIDTFYPKKHCLPEKANFSRLSASKTLNGGKWDYVVITSEALKPVFQELVNWKIRKGLRAMIATVEMIDEMYSNKPYTLQKKIRTFLFSLHSSGHYKYVLLGGDSSVVPIQYCQVKRLSDGIIKTDITPCDMFYSNLSYPNYEWDSNGNGIYGEFSDQNSLEQDVYVTRAAVSTATEATTFVNKVITYETAPANYSKLAKMLFVGARVNNNIGSTSDTHYKCEQAFQSYIFPYWSYIHAYLYDTGSNISSYNNLTADNFKQLINSGYHFIHNESHGEAQFFDFNNIWLYDINAANSQTNTTPSIFVTSSCFSNAFDSLCISKALMNATGGALAYFGSSRSGLYYTSNNIGPSLLYDSYFFQNLFTGLPSDAPYKFGAVVAETKRQFADEAYNNETNGWRHLTLSINPLGDPEMPIYTQVPASFNNVSVTVEENNQVTVSTGGIPGCTIALVSTDGGATYFDVAENVSSYTFTDVIAPCYVTVTKHNYKPYTTSNAIIPKYSIQGTGSLCGDNVYSVNNLPEDYSVVWSFANSSSPVNNLIHNNTPSANMCTISNPNSLHINEYLNAVIKKEGVICGNATIAVSTAGNFSANFNQLGGTQNGITYPNITNSLSDNSHQGAFELREITITSSDFANCNLNYSGFNPTQFYVSGNSLHIKFPSVGGTAKQCLITGVKSNECKIFQFYLHILPSSNLTNLLQTDFSISSIGRNFTVTLKEPNGIFTIDGVSYECKVSLPDEWILSVVNAYTGDIVYNAKAKGISTVFDTSDWKQGVYIAACEVDGKVTTKKFTIK